MVVDINNLYNFSLEEYRHNLLRLGVESHISLVGQEVYYCEKCYGVHLVIKWDSDKAMFLLDLDGQRFWSNPFRILRCKQ